MRSYILALDQGTTSSRALVLDRGLRVLGSGQREFSQLFPRPGWVEHSPQAIWDSVAASVQAALRASGVKPDRIAGIGIANQRETVLCWDGRTGAPLHNAIVWQDRRTAELCQRLKQRGLERLFSRKTGLVLDPYFSGTKLSWLLENVPGLKSKTEAGRLKAGTVDSYLVFRLTGGAVHVTDASNASRTLLLDLRKLFWDEELCSILGVPASILPRVAGNCETFGRTKGLGFLPDGIPICGLAGDQQAALFGQACFKEGEAKCTFGTGSFLLMNTGAKPVFSRNRLLSTVAWRVQGRTTYALEGSAFIAGAAVQWLRDGLGLIKKSSDIEALARKVDSSEGVVLVPAFAGLGAPHWRPGARGQISGLSRGTTAAHLARAALEGIALQNLDLIEAMEADSGLRLRSLKVDGGAAGNDLLMQIQADVAGCRLIRPRVVEATALGAGLLAGLAVGFWSSQAEIAKAWKRDRVFAPRMPSAERRRLLGRPLCENREIRENQVPFSF